MKRWLKIALIILACLVVFQMFFRYDIKTATEDRPFATFYNFNTYDGPFEQVPVALVTDRLTGRGYWFSSQYWLFPYPHAIK